MDLSEKYLNKLAGMSENVGMIALASVAIPAFTEKLNLFSGIAGLLVTFFFWTFSFWILSKT